MADERENAKCGPRDDGCRNDRVPRQKIVARFSAFGQRRAADALEGDERVRERVQRAADADCDAQDRRIGQLSENSAGCRRLAARGARVDRSANFGRV